MRRADEMQYNLAYAGKGWHNIEDHYSLSYDRIKFDIVNVVVREYQDAKGISEEQKEEKILANQQVIKTPIVRNGKQAAVGYAPEVWKAGVKLNIKFTVGNDCARLFAIKALLQRNL